MTRGVEHIEGDALDLHFVAFGHPHGNDIDPALLAHDSDAVRSVTQGSRGQ